MQEKNLFLLTMTRVLWKLWKTPNWCKTYTKCTFGTKFDVALLISCNFYTIMVLSSFYTIDYTKIVFWCCIEDAACCWVLRICEWTAPCCFILGVILLQFITVIISSIIVKSYRGFEYSVVYLYLLKLWYSQVILISYFITFANYICVGLKEYSGVVIVCFVTCTCTRHSCKSSRHELGRRAICVNVSESSEATS